MAENTQQITPSDLLTICQAKLIKIPYTMETEEAVGQPIRDVVALLEKLKQAIVNAHSNEGE